VNPASAFGWGFAVSFLGGLLLPWPVGPVLSLAIGLNLWLTQPREHVRGQDPLGCRRCLRARS
jgi:hypothetical protein